MTLLWFDGFETYNTNALAQQIPELITCDITDAGGSTGRRSSGRLYLADSWRNYDVTLQNTLTDNTIIIFGVALYRNHTAAWGYNATYPLMWFADNAGYRHINVHAKASARVIEMRDGAGSILGTGTWTMPYQEWVYFEIKIYVHDTAGTVETKINGDTDISLTSQDTKNGANGWLGKLQLSTPYQTCPMLYDDLYLCNGQGSKNNDFLGDIRVDVLRPNGAGAHSDFTPNAGSNYQNVDENYPDDDTTYNYSNTVGHKDTYALPSLESLGTTIHGVKNQIRVRKDDAGSRKIKVISRLNSTNYLSPEKTLSDTYKTFRKIYEDNPDDAAAFEEADITGMESGIEITV